MGRLETQVPGIARKTTVDASADWLRRLILSGELLPGQRLPPERELAEQLGVNRMTLRAALARLALEGLLSARQGSGHTVQDFRQSGGPGLVPGVLEVLGDGGLREVAVRDLLATRRLLARLVFERAAGVVDTIPAGPRERGAVLDRLRGAIERFQTLCEQPATPEELGLADRAIVEALIGLTESPVLPLFMNPMVQIMGAMPDLLRAIYVDPRGNASGWRAALAWLEATPRPAVGRLEEILEMRDQTTMKRLFGGREGSAETDPPTDQKKRR